MERPIREQRLQWVLTPTSGHVRIPTCEPCEVRSSDGLREGNVWNLSLLGMYLAIDAPLPERNQPLRLTFSLTGDPPPVVCDAKVAWKNPPSLIIQGLGARSFALPPGCGLVFTSLDPADRARIEARISADPGGPRASGRK